jgi:GAF domain-containing protein
MTGNEPPTTDADFTAALTADFSETARALLSVDDVHDTLDRVATLAVATIDGSDYASVFLVEQTELAAAVSTDPVVAELDAAQRQSGQGPCLAAIARGTTIYAGDFSDEHPWPDFGRQATANGIRSMLACPLFVDGTLGSLNLYARYPLAFGVIDRAKAVLLAGLAAVAISAALTHEEEKRQSSNLHAALATRELIGQAQGILIERERVTPDQAFDILRRASQHLNLKLRDVAQSLVETGERPNTGPIR